MSVTKIYIVDNPLLPEPAVVEYATENVADFLVAHFKKWPVNARVYNGAIREENDVTPNDEPTLLRLNALGGPLYVVLYPQGVAVAIVVAVVALAVAAAVLFKPKIPNVAVRAQNGSTATSPNNSLGERSNRARPLRRIPDIFGTVRSTPDLLGTPYRVFENNREVEYALFCIGRGSYEVSDIREDRTLISSIPGSSVEIFAPGHNPADGVVQLRVGSAITQPLVSAKRYSFGAGQVLHPPNTVFPASQPIVCTYLNGAMRGVLTLQSSSGEDFRDYFIAGMTLSMSGFIWVVDPEPPGISANLNGNYTIESITRDTITIVLTSVGDWSWCPSEVITTGTLSSTGYRYLGPFDIDTPVDQVWVNIVAEQGLYRDNGTSREAVSVNAFVELTPINSAGQTTGAAQNVLVNLTGSAGDTLSFRATTAKITPNAGNSRYRVRIYRATTTNLTYNGQVYDTIKWRDIYGVTLVSSTAQADFGDVTIAYSAVTGTREALAIQDRKLNMLVTRLIPHMSWTYLGGVSWTAAQASNRAVDIICAMVQDPYIGRRQASQIDFANIYQQYTNLVAALGDDDQYVTFGYTFDEENMSFEEALLAVCTSTFTTPYTQGSVLRVLADIPLGDNILLFNHRNKIPGSEVRTVTFGLNENADSVELQYVDPDNYDELKTIYAPDWGTPGINSKKVETLGVRNHLQAFVLLRRYWNRLFFQHVSLEFEATQEANILAVGNRILVADNTRSATYDGEVVSQNSDATILELSTEFPYDPGYSYSIFLQLPDGTVDSIALTDCLQNKFVTLARAPRRTLSLSPNNFARATYQIVRSDDTHITQFVVVEKTPNSNFTVKIKAVNHDSRIYQDDLSGLPA